MKGKFISLEGGEGSGKSTALNKIEAWLIAKNIPYVMTREPGGTPLAEQIRELVLSKRDETVDVMAELLLVFAARAQHMNQVIVPALETGKWVISDRFIDSSYVYQGYGRGIDSAFLDTLTQNVVKAYLPDATLLLDVPVAVGLERVAARKQADRLDGETLAFHESVREGFLSLAKQYPNRISLINAAQPLDDVEYDIVQQLSRLREEWEH